MDALAPLRAFLVSTSRSRASAEPQETVGKRYIQGGDLTDLVPRAVARVSEHFAALYGCAVEALEAEQHGDLGAAVRALLRAGLWEERVGRYQQSGAWYYHARRIAEGLRDRRPEIESLRHLGHLEAARGYLEAAARLYERSYRLAENELDNEGATLACEGQGEVAVAQSKWQGAEAWYTRGLRFVGEDHPLAARLYLGLSRVARQRDQPQLAVDRLKHARHLFEQLQHGEGMVLSLKAAGDLEAAQSHHAEALTLYLEALNKLPRAGGTPELEMEIRLRICELFVSWGRLPDAEDHVRRAEETAIMNNLTAQLARLYVLMGKLRGRQGDEQGFVFFEKAIELCQGAEPAPRLEAEVYREYGLFRTELGERDEGLAYLQRAREILETLDHDSMSQSVNRSEPTAQ